MGFDGYMLLAILTLFFVYLLPTLIRSAQVVRDARVEDRFSSELRIITTGGKAVSRDGKSSTVRTYLHHPRSSRHHPRQPERTMHTPVAQRLAAADARRVAAARAARVAASSRRAAAAKRRMLLVSVLGALSISGWILTAMVSFTWVVPSVLTAATIVVVEIGRRTAAAGVAADATLAERVRVAEARAGLSPRGVTDQTQSRGSAQADQGESAQSGATQPAASETSEQGSLTASSLRVDVDPAKVATEDTDEGWTPVPVPRPAYALKSTAPRRLIEPFVGEESAEAASNSFGLQAPEETPAPELPADVDKVPGWVSPAPSAHAPDATAQVESEEPEVSTNTLNVQEILARRRAVG